MKTVTVGELRQNPTATLAAVEAGDTYRVTRHQREVGRLVPPGDESIIIPAKRQGGAHTSRLQPVQITTADSIDELIDEMRGEW